MQVLRSGKQSAVFGSLWFAALDRFARSGHARLCLTLFYLTLLPDLECLKSTACNQAKCGKARKIMDFAIIIMHVAISNRLFGANLSIFAYIASIVKLWPRAYAQASSFRAR